jgi:ribosomal protein S27E
MTVECSNCKTKQKIHVAVRPGFSKKADERISCINCGDQFKGSVPDKIIHGPFPA